MIVSGLVVAVLGHVQDKQSPGSTLEGRRRGQAHREKEAGMRETVVLGR